MADLTPAQKNKIRAEKAYSTQMGAATRKAIFEYTKNKDASQPFLIPGYVVKNAKSNLDKIWKKGSAGGVAPKK